MFLATIPCRDPPGLSETNPVVFKDATSEGFEDLLWVFYNPYVTIVFDQMTNSLVSK